MLRLSALLLVVCLVSTHAGASDEAMALLAKPAAAFASHSPSGADIRWAAGAIPADGYNVYGFWNGDWQFLASAGPEGRSAFVAVGYLAYAVSALVGEEESPLALAFTVGNDCLTVDPLPPSVGVGQCVPREHALAAVKIRRLV